MGSAWSRAIAEARYQAELVDGWMARFRAAPWQDGEPVRHQPPFLYGAEYPMRGFVRCTREYCNDHHGHMEEMPCCAQELHRAAGSRMLTVWIDMGRGTYAYVCEAEVEIQCATVTTSSTRPDA